MTPPPKKVNHIGLEVVQYKGSKTTLCAGCGHNSISERIVEAFYDLGVKPHTVAKFSGIGCSSKSPAYFLGLSHGFNGVHGRMPAIATGALLANSTLMGLGVTGDGDTASIGLGQFMHLVRRNMPDDLRHREQRRVRPHQGPVFGHRRSRLHPQNRPRQRSAAVRLLRSGAQVGRHVRGPLLQRRQETACRPS